MINNSLGFCASQDTMSLQVSGDIRGKPSAADPCGGPRGTRYLRPLSAPCSHPPLLSVQRRCFMSFSRDLNGLTCPEEGILLSEITRVKLPELKGYVKELERLGKARGTGDITWLPAGLPEDTVSLVAPRISQGTPTRPGPSGSQRISFSGWPILPSVSTKEPNQKSRRKPPIGDAKLANAACAALPSNISDGA
jgi:hypothetical protein